MSRSRYPVRVEGQETFEELESLRQRYYPVVVDGWAQDNVPAAQAATEAVRGAGRWKALRAGSVVGLMVQMEASQARTAGTLTVELFKSTVHKTTGVRSEASTNLKVVLDATNPVRHIVLRAKGLTRYYEGDELYPKVSTDGSWAPTTGDIDIAIEVES